MTAYVPGFLTYKPMTAYVSELVLALQYKFAGSKLVLWVETSPTINIEGEVWTVLTD